MTTASADAPVELDVRRGRPRNESCSADILTATLELVAEVGIARLTMDAVASRAGVGKATIYRRWSTKEALLLDAWMSCVRPPVVPDTGSLRGDLDAILRNVDQPMASSELQRVYPQMIAAAKVNPDVDEAYRAFIAQRRLPMRTVLERAAARGEIDPGIELDVVHDLLVAPLLFRWLLSDTPVPDQVVDRIIGVVIAGISPR
jgi:AcrR family transcriptional regulator